MSHPPPHTIDPDLARAKTLVLTTTGRRSGQPRKAQIWFVTDGACFYVQAGPKGQKGWYVNLRANPRVVLSIGSREIEGVARPVEDRDEARRVLELVRRKYWLARLASWFGTTIGHGMPVAIAPVE